jgi:hypothetical protein
MKIKFNYEPGVFIILPCVGFKHDRNMHVLTDDKREILIGWGWWMLYIAL